LQSAFQAVLVCASLMTQLLMQFWIQSTGRGDSIFRIQAAADVKFRKFKPAAAAHNIHYRKVLGAELLACAISDQTYAR
jgi:hypothetical protein